MAEIVKTRITPKKLTDEIISRERLLNIIGNNLSKNVILIVSPAGFGKTTLVLDFFKQSGKKYAWLYLAPDVYTLKSFMRYLVYSLKELNNEFGTTTLELLNSMSESRVLVNDEANSISSVIGTFVNEFLSCFHEEVYLVIDDLHNAGGKLWVAGAFNCLIEDFPTNLHIFITSRALPEFNYSRIVAKRKLLRIDSSELNFDREETYKLLKEIYSIDCTDNDLKLLSNKLEGWVTGLHLLLQAYGKNFASLINKESKIEENIFNFFAEEVFNSLDDDAKDFLLITSMVDSFNEDLCKSIPGIKNPESIINGLKKKNIFLESSIDESAGSGMKFSYSYHNLFNQFLQAKLPEVKSKSEIEKIAAGIFEYYSKNKDTLNAIEYSIRAKNYVKAAELIIESFENLLTEGRFEQLEKWIGSFPENILETFPKLKYFRALVLKQFKVDLDTASSLFTEVTESEDEGSELYILASSELAEIMLVKGKPGESVNALNELLKLCEDVNLRIKVSISLAKAYYRLGSKYYEKILKILDSAIESCDRHGIREFHSELYSLFGRVYQNKGDFSKSLHYLKNVVQLEKNIFRKFQAITDIVLLHSWSGEYSKAKDSLDSADEIHRKYYSAAFKRSMLRTTALFKFEAGDYEDSIALLTELNTIDIKNNIHSYSFLYYLFICESYILLNKKEKANEFLSLAESSKESKEEYRELLINYHRAIISNLGEPAQSVEKAFLSALKYFDEHGLVYSKTQVEFHLADYYFKSGNAQTALKYLTDSLNTSSQKQFNSFLVQHFILKRYLFDFAGSNKLQTDYIRTIYDIFIERSNNTWLSEDCAQRMKEENVSLFDITLNTFGGVELYVRGVPVEEERWVRKKSKLLLIYLLIHKEQKHTKDKILELFFGDLSSTSAENVFHQAITNIRNIVKPASIGTESKEKKKPGKETAVMPVDSIIQYEDKILRISPGLNYRADISEFTRLTNLVRSPETEESQKVSLAKQAAEIYKGEFLPGYYDGWIEEIRINMQNRFIILCEWSLEALKKKSKYDEIIYYGERLIKEDKLHVEGFISLIEAYTRAGNINMAKKKFSQLLKNFEEEYSEKPEKEVLDRVGKILNSI